MIIDCLDHKNFAAMRMASATVDEYVCYVDDDDYIHPDALKVCLKALQTTDATVAFTHEVVVTESGQICQVRNARRTWEQAIAHPRTIHHLTMWKSSAVDGKALALDAKYGCGIDWFIKVGAALKGDALHVPIDGYSWVQHRHSMTATRIGNIHYRMEEMSNDIKATWGDRKGLIAQFTKDLW